jgi:uncharacterized protein (TIGR03382 family)
MLASIARLALGVLVGLTPSCVLDGGPEADSANGTAIDDLTGDDGATEPVCTLGHYRCHAQLRVHAQGVGVRPFATVPPRGAYGAQDLQSAYRIDPNVIPDAKPTIAIVDAYGYPSLESDLTVYRTQYGMSACTIANGCLKVVNENGQTSPLPPLPPAGDDWTLETALDLDLASAACPKCNLLVVQADNNTGDGMFLAQNVATQLGATVISNSWGGGEDSSSTEMARLEGFFAHPGIAIFVAAGDKGYTDQAPDYPSTSAHVIAVGGTHLVRDTSARGWSETAWTGGGSSCSQTIAKPDYQTSSPCKFKAAVDLAAVGDPTTGMAIYNARAGGWGTVGGTSASAPFIAGLWAATGNGAQTSGAFIAANASKFYDVTTGSNGTCAPSTLLCTAALGWDGPTGYGTPNAQALTVAAATNPGNGSNSDSGDVSGGCSSGGNAGAAALLGLALVGLRRRRGLRGV